MRLNLILALLLLVVNFANAAQENESVQNAENLIKYYSGEQLAAALVSSSPGAIAKFLGPLKVSINKELFDSCKENNGRRTSPVNCEEGAYVTDMESGKIIINDMLVFEFQPANVNEKQFNWWKDHYLACGKLNFCNNKLNCDRWKTDELILSCRYLKANHTNWRNYDVYFPRIKKTVLELP